MPAKDFLDLEEKKNLQKALKEEERAEVRERILMFLLLNDGKTQREIAEFIGCSLKTVAPWCVHGDPNNLESLEDGRKNGNHKKATEEYINLLLKIVDEDPKEFGYEFGRWTAARLAEHLEKETGIKLSGSQVRRILRRKKYVYIWAKYSLEDKQDKKLRKAFKEKLDEYLKLAKEKPESIQVWFWDGAFKVATQVRHTAPHECGFSLRVIRRRAWTKKGKRKKVNGQRKRGRVNVMGALRYNDKKRVCFMIKKGNSETFHEKLKKLHEEIRQEWINLGNLTEDFRENGPKIIIILDNASYHKKKDVIEQVEKELPNIRLEFLPAYSPDYHLIELVWHSAKEYIANREFENKEELEKVVNQLLNEGGLIIKWSRKLKNKGNAVNVT
ncbi:MAG: IS630 family transposase [Microcystis wesenbergii Mw_MB_S_20031200_S109]|nr:MAG: IS630 family transposase [Microcystis wesenbergii Mw_MB_S_20031200_S109]